MSKRILPGPGYSKIKPPHHASTCHHNLWQSFENDKVMWSTTSWSISTRTVPSSRSRDTVIMMCAGEHNHWDFALSISRRKTCYFWIHFVLSSPFSGYLRSSNEKLMCSSFTQATNRFRIRSPYLVNQTTLNFISVFQDLFKAISFVQSPRHKPSTCIDTGGKNWQHSQIQITTLIWPF